MCIKHAPITVKELRQLADAIEQRWAFDVRSKECDESIRESLKEGSDFTVLITEVVDSLLGIVTLKEVPVAGPERLKRNPKLVGLTIPKVDQVDYDTIIHSVYNVCGE